MFRLRVERVGKIGSNLLKSCSRSSACQLNHGTAEQSQAPLAFDGFDDLSSNKGQKLESLLSHKTTRELLRALFVFKVSSIRCLVTHSNYLFSLAQHPLLAPLTRPVLKETFYKQFCSGDGIENVQAKLKDINVSGMLYIPLEASANKGEMTFDGEKALDDNVLTFGKFGKMTKDLDNGKFVQAKITALFDMDLLLEMNKQLIAYETDHREPEEWSIGRLRNLIQDNNTEAICIPSLSKEMNVKFCAAVRRLNGLVKMCADNNLLLLLDAEQTYIQASIGYIILLMQSIYNKGTPVVYNTYQCYRKDTYDRVRADVTLAEKLGFKVAAKTVRGAYMIEERKRADEFSLEDPINDSYDSTSMMYDECVAFMLGLARQEKAGIMVATHNEGSITKAVKKMDQMKLDPLAPNVFFGQLFGFADHITTRLGASGYNVYKSVPYGELNTTLLYLARRAQENLSATERSSIELRLAQTALKSRLSQAIRDTPRFGQLQL